MSIELRVPEVGESITEVQIGDWLKGEGEAVAKDEALVVIETDKVTVELPAPQAGTVTKVLKASGETAEVGEVIGQLEPGDGPGGSAEGSREAGARSREAQGSSKPGADVEAQRPATGEEDEEEERPREGDGEEDEDERGEEQRGKDQRRQDESGGGGDGGHVMPAARRALADAGLRAEDVRGTGPGGRLLKEDVDRAARSAAARPASGAPPRRAGAGDEEVVLMSPLRRRIAERLVQAQQNAAILTTFNEVDMSAVSELRRASQERFRAKHGTKLGFMSFFVKAAVEALKRVPQVNAEIRGTDVVYKNYYDVGVAVGGGKGLVVPVLRGAERLSFAEIEVAIADFAERARANRLGLEELQGGTFTISNGGVYGSLLSTPILNPPQSGILGLHAIQERPVVREGAVVVRPMMYVALSYDHRIVDGREAVTFLKTVVECVEDPARILLEI